MLKNYKTVSEPKTYEFEEKRSRFIGRIFPISDEIQAAEIIADIKKKHHDARHNCSAFILKNGFEKYSDDGEPQGTAGKPILEVIRKNGLSDVLIVVTRYFGGILLGAGGLTRAYSHSAAESVNAAEIKEMQPHCLCEVKCPYADYSSIKRVIDACGGRELQSEYGEEITVKLIIASEKTRYCAERIVETTAGRLELKINGEIFAAKQE